MKENKFFRRIDKFAYNRLWLLEPDGFAFTWEWNGGFWKRAIPEFDLNDPKASRPIDVAQLKIEIKHG
jgi:hypothetical protein